MESTRSLLLSPERPMGSSSRISSRIITALAGLVAVLALAAAFVLAPSPAHLAQADMACPACGSPMSLDITQPATCVTPGAGIYFCTNPDCPEPGTVYPATIPATGHNFSHETGRVNPTCTNDGYIEYSCTNITPTGGPCGATSRTTLPALGHSFGDWTIEAGTADGKPGRLYRTCSRCGENQEYQTISHMVPEEKIVELGFLSIVHGKHKTAPQTTPKEEGPTITEEPPATEQPAETPTVEEKDSKKPVGPWILGFAALAAFMGLAYGMFIRPRKLAAAAAKAAAEAAANEAGMAKAISTAFKNNPKTILLCVGENNVGGPLVRALEGRHYLSIRSLDLDQLYSLPEEAAEMKPDLIVLHLYGMRNWADQAAIMECTREVYEDARFSLLVSDPGDIEEYNHLKREMDALKENGVILGYVFDSEVETNGFIRLVLPLYKETIVSDNSPACIGVVADLLGIPGVSTVVSTFTSGRQIKDVMAAGDLSAGDKAVVIADIAEALGLSNVVSVAALVDYANTIQRTIVDDGKVSGKTAESAGESSPDTED